MFGQAKTEIRVRYPRLAGVLDGRLHALPRLDRFGEAAGLQEIDVHQPPMQLDILGEERDGVELA